MLLSTQAYIILLFFYSIGYGHLLDSAFTIILVAVLTFCRGGAMMKGVVRSGISFGSALAIVISYTAHESVLWAIIHGIFSWLYVIYFLLTR